MLSLGGLENSPPNTDPSPNKFKVAKNVSFNKNKQLTPRPSFLAPVVSPSIHRWNHLATYVGDKLFAVGVYESGADKIRDIWVDGVQVPRTSELGVDYTGSYTRNFSDQTFELNKLKFVLAGAGTTYSALYKYDGYETYLAGIPSPYMIPKNYSSTGATYVKVINHSLDFQGNSIASDTVSFRADGTQIHFNQIVYGNGMFVGVGDEGIAYSYDGILWDCSVENAQSTTYSPVRPKLTGVAYGNGIFVAVSSDITSISNVTISTDGKNWIQPATSGSIDYWPFVGITFGAGKFVAISQNGTAATRIFYSTDAITWIPATAPNTNNLTCIKYFNGYFIALANTGVGNRCSRSIDAITWTAQTTPSDRQWTSISGGLHDVAGTLTPTWVGVASDGTTANQIMVSTDNGVTWTSKTSPQANSWRSVTHVFNIDTNADAFIAVSSNGTNRIMKSVNGGNTWTVMSAPNALAYSCITYGAISVPSYPLPTTILRVVAGATDGTDNALMYSDYPALTSWEETRNPASLTIETSGLNLFYSLDQFLNSTGNSIKYTEPVDGRMDSFLRAEVQYNALTQEFDIITNSLTNDILDQFNWVGENPTGNTHIIRLLNFTVNSTDYTALAYKYKTDTTKFYKTLLGFNPNTLLWDSIDATALPEASGYIVASRRFITVWVSPIENGIYYFKGAFSASSSIAGDMTKVRPTSVCVDIGAPTIANLVNPPENTPFFISGALDGWYNAFSVKSSFNEIGVPMVAMTNYQDQLLIATDDLIYFSDPSLGGVTSPEMRAGLSFVRIGESEQGRITSICGTKDWLLVSRERKVYMVAGSLSTQNYRIQEIQGIAIGAYSNSCMQEVDGNVIMVSSVGAWVINGPNATSISEGVQLNFRTYFKRYLDYLPTEEKNSVIFNMSDYPTTAWDSSVFGKYITVSYDCYKRIVIFTDYTSAKCGGSLVFHLTNSEWTNWDSYDLDTLSVSAMTAINGTIYTATFDDDFARLKVEDKSTSVFTYDYSARSAPRLVTTWITAGEPSLEKQLLQLKIYGYLWSNLTIKHYENWNLETAVTNTTYVTPGNYVFYHKQRLNSSKVLAAGIEISLPSNGSSFWIEGMEVEYDMIQSGMKK